MHNSEKKELRVKRVVNFRDIAVRLTCYFTLITIVAAEMPSFFKKKNVSDQL